MASKFILELPLPPKELHAHTGGSKWAKIKATKECKGRAYIEALAIKSCWDTLAKSVLSYDFYFPDLIQRDTMNVAASCKPYVDGMVDAGVMADDNWRVMSVGHVRAVLDRENPRVVLTVEGID